MTSMEEPEEYLMRFLGDQGDLVSTVIAKWHKGVAAQGRVAVGDPEVTPWAGDPARGVATGLTRKCRADEPIDAPVTYDEGGHFPPGTTLQHLDPNSPPLRVRSAAEQTAIINAYYRQHPDQETPVTVDPGTADLPTTEVPAPEPADDMRAAGDVAPVFGFVCGVCGFMERAGALPDDVATLVADHAACAAAAYRFKITVPAALCDDQRRGVARDVWHSQVIREGLRATDNPLEVGEPAPDDVTSYVAGWVVPAGFRQWDDAGRVFIERKPEPADAEPIPAPPWPDGASLS